MADNGKQSEPPIDEQGTLREDKPTTAEVTQEEESTAAPTSTFESVAFEYSYDY